MTEPTSIPPILDDRPAHQDTLGFQPYVDALGDILRDPNTNTPLVVGVYGPWGSGKTSLMAMLRDVVAGDEEATATPHHRTVWFNAWKYNRETALWRALLLLLLDDLERLLKADPPPAGEDEPKAEELLTLLREALYHETSWSEFGERKADLGQALGAGANLAFNLIVSSIPLGLAKEAMDEARKTFGKGEPVSQVSRLLQAFRREELVHYQAQLRSLEQFQDNFERLVRLLLRREGGRPRRLVVFVDDLDRCLPDKAVQVLEAIKLFLDVEGCMYVLGLDREAIEQAVQARYSAMHAHRAGEVKAREYLEKIVQLPFILPPIEDEDMRRYVDALAPSLPDPRCAEVFAQGLAPNPRQVKRTLNIFLLLRRLVDRRPALAETVTSLRLAKLVAIQHAHPDLYNLLRLRPGYLRELEAHFRAARDGARGGGADREGEEGALPALPEALQPYSGREALRRLLCLFEDEDARFDHLTPLDVRSYLTLARRAAPVEAPAAHAARLAFEPELVEVPAGPFLIGTSEAQVRDMLARYEWAKALQDNGSFAREQPQHELTLPAYQIGRYPVTNAEYAAFVEATGRDAPQHWREGRFPEELADHPVVYVSWRDALAYVQWLAERAEQPYRLPTEAEWEKAARGDDGRLWPWGDEWNPARANCRPAGPGETTPVGQYSAAGGDSPCGAADMAGNVWEWCSGLWGDDPNKPSFGYPFRADDGREELEASGYRILRGGCYGNDPGLVRCGFRSRSNPGLRIYDHGFRVARGSHL